LSDRSGQTWWKRAERFGRALETTLITVILGGLVLFASAQILLRNVFSVGVTWSDGLIRLVVLWLALLGTLAASREGRHLTMGAITRWLPQRLQTVTGVTTDLFAAAFCALLARYAVTFVLDSREGGDTLLNGVPAWWLQAPLPVAFALSAWQFLTRAVLRAFGRLAPPQEVGL
jgi:TRAP-type C4-dicarboxylate transport system permease small subunit